MTKASLDKILIEQDSHGTKAFLVKSIIRQKSNLKNAAIDRSDIGQNPYLMKASMDKIILGKNSMDKCVNGKRFIGQNLLARSLIEQRHHRKIPLLETSFICQMTQFGKNNQWANALQVEKNKNFI